MCCTIRRKLLPGCLTALLTVGLCGCVPTDETITSLVDLAAMTSGSLVEIAVKAVINGILAQNPLNLYAPISEQSH